MMSETQAGTLAVLSIVLAAVSAAALAQYSASDPRSTIYNNESLRREDEIKRNEEAARRQSDQGQSGAGASVGSQYNPARDAQTHAAFKAARARLLKMAPLPDDRNPLLGRWRVESRVMAGSRNDMQLLMGMLSNPGGAACEITFGGGITEFRPKSWASIDGSGNDSLGPIAYRADGKRLWAIPDKGIELIGFEVANPNRVVVVNLEGCALVRVGSAAPAAQSGPSNRAPASSKTGAPPPIASVTPAPPPSTPSRPPAEVCRNTLLDKLGTVGVDQVRAMAKVRFTEAAIEGKVPNTDNLRTRPARQCLRRRPARQGVALRLRRQRHAAVDHLCLGPSARAGTGADISGARDQRFRASTVAAAAVARSAAGRHFAGAPDPAGHA